MNPIDRVATGVIQVGAIPIDRAIKQKLGKAASDIDTETELQARLDLCINHMNDLISHLYDVDADGKYLNIDRKTYKILLLPLPWGENGAIKWGIKKWEGHCFRKLLLDRVFNPRRLPCLFDYNQFSRDWFIDFYSYPDLPSAFRWVKCDGPNLQEWTRIVNDYREQERRRKEKIKNAL